MAGRGRTEEGGHCGSQGYRGCQTMDPAGVGGLDRTNEPFSRNTETPQSRAAISFLGYPTLISALLLCHTPLSSSSPEPEVSCHVLVAKTVDLIAPPNPDLKLHTVHWTPSWLITVPHAGGATESHTHLTRWHCQPSDQSLSLSTQKIPASGTSLQRRLEAPTSGCGPDGLSLPTPAGAGRSEARARQTQEAVPREGGRAGSRQSARGAARDRGQEAAAAGGRAQERAGPGRG